MMIQHRQQIPSGVQAKPRLAGCLGGPKRPSRQDDLPREFLARLTAEGVAVNLSPGEMLACEGAVADSVLLLVRGVAMKFATLPGDRRHIAGFAYAPALVLPPRFDAPWHQGLRAVNAVAFYRIGQLGFQRVLQQEGRFYPVLLGLAQDELCDQQDLLLTLACRTPPERIANFLLRAARNGMAEGEGDDTVALPMTRVQIADHLGLAPETVSRTFARLAADGLVSLPRPSRVVLQDLAALSALAEGRALA